MVVPDKAERVCSFHRNTVHALAELLAAAGLSHPGELGPHHLIRRVSSTEIKLFSQLYYFVKPGALLKKQIDSEFYARIWSMAQADSFAAMPQKTEHGAAQVEEPVIS